MLRYCHCFTISSCFGCTETYSVSAQELATPVPIIEETQNDKLSKNQIRKNRVSNQSEQVFKASEGSKEERKEYLKNESWSFDESKSIVDPNNPSGSYRGKAYYSAKTKININKDKQIDVEAKFEKDENTNSSASFLTSNPDQSKHRADGSMFYEYEGNSKDLPSLGIRTSLSIIDYEKDGNIKDLKGKLNFNGAKKVGTLSLTFGEEVTNPILDISGLGGYKVYGYGKDGRSFARGSFNATDIELVKGKNANDEDVSDLKFKLKNGNENLQVTEDGKKIEVKNRNTSSFSEKELRVKQKEIEIKEKDGKLTKRINTPNLVQAGVGSVLIEGTFKELLFNLYHHAVPFSESSDADDIFKQNDENIDEIKGSVGEELLPDGINGINSNEIDNVSTLDRKNVGNNADLFVLSVRVPKPEEVEKPVEPEKPEIEKPELEEPENPEKPKEEKPEVEEPGNPEKPEVEKPEVEEPGNPEKPEVEKPEVEEPGNPEKPKEEKPELEEPGNPKKPEVEKPELEEPGNPEKPEVEKPEVEEPGNPEKPEVEKTEEEEPGNPEKPKEEKPELEEPGNPEKPKEEKPEIEEPGNQEKPKEEKPELEEPKNPEKPERSEAEEPDKPTTEEPKKPIVKQPEKPVTKEPQKPIVEEPGKPVTKEPKKPIAKEPEKPTIKESEKPKSEEPKKPMVEELEKLDSEKTEKLVTKESKKLIPNVKKGSSKNLPKTGDGFNPSIYTGVMSLAGGLLTLLGIKRKK